MSEYLVRWKYAANSLVNRNDVETNWYEQFHLEKRNAVNQYVSLLNCNNETPSFKMTVEIFRLTKVTHDQPERIIETNHKGN